MTSGCPLNMGVLCPMLACFFSISGRRDRARRTASGFPRSLRPRRPLWLAGLQSALLILAAAMAPSCAADPGFVKGVLAVKNVTAAPGDAVQVEVVMDAALRSVATVQFILDFTLVEPAGAPIPTPFPADPKHPNNGEAQIILGPMVPPNTLSMASGAVKGKVQVAIAGIVGFDGPGTLVTIPLRVPQNAAPGTIYNLQLTVLILNGPYLNPLPHQAMSGYLRIVRPHRFMLGSTSALPGREVAVSVAYWAGDGAAPRGVSMRITAEAAQGTGGVPQILTAQRGPAYPSSGFFFTPLQQNQARLMLLSPESPLKTGSLLFLLRIRVPTTADDGDEIALRISDVMLYPTPGEQTHISAPPSTIRISIPPGDLNADGRVTIVDAMLCARMVVRLTWPVPARLLRRADVAPKIANGKYGDGVITVADVARILRRALGIDVGPWP